MGGHTGCIHHTKFTHKSLKCKQIHKHQFKATKSFGHTVSSVDCSALEAGAVSVLNLSGDVLCSGIIFWADNMSPPMSLLCPVFFATEHGLPGICFGSPQKSRSPVGRVLPVPDFFDDVLVLTILHSKFTINHQQIYFQISQTIQYIIVNICKLIIHLMTRFTMTKWCHYNNK